MNNEDANDEAKMDPDRVQLDERVARLFVADLLSEPTGELQECLGAEFPRIDDYLIDRKLGEGGGGTVYHAHKPGRRGSLALKLLHRTIGDERAVQRAWRELDILDQLQLPSVPRIYEHGMYEGRLYIAADYIDGRPLDQYCDEQRLDLRQRVKLLIRVAGVVESLHERGIIHRDIKPENILVQSDGLPFLIDLGIAGFLDSDRGEAPTIDGMPIGSVAFMPPEQARGDSRAISTRSDVYAFGATACYVLTGHTPFDTSGTLAEALHRLTHDPARDPGDLDPSLPQPLVAILMRALAPCPSERFVSIAALADDLQRWIDGLPVESQKPSWWRNRILAMRRNPGRWAWSSAAGVVIAAFATFGIAGQVHAFEMRTAERVEEAFLSSIRGARHRATDDSWEDRLKMIRFVSTLEGSGYQFADQEIPSEIYRDRDALATAVLEPIFADELGEMSTVDLAMSAVAAVYRTESEWDDEVEIELRRILAQLEDDPRQSAQ